MVRRLWLGEVKREVGGRRRRGFGETGGSVEGLESRFQGRGVGGGWGFAGEEGVSAGRRD